MSRWIHPDRLDRLAAGAAAPGPDLPASAEVALSVLDHVICRPGLRRLPRKSRPRDILLAALCLNLQRRHPYAEPDINAHLQDVLNDLGAEIDHVTCRRYLIELGFLRRDRAGARYFVDPLRMADTLSAEAMDAIHAFLEQHRG